MGLVTFLCLQRHVGELADPLPVLAAGAKEVDGLTRQEDLDKVRPRQVLLSGFFCAGSDRTLGSPVGLLQQKVVCPRYYYSSSATPNITTTRVSAGEAYTLRAR